MLLNGDGDGDSDSDSDNGDNYDNYNNENRGYVFSIKPYVSASIDSN